MNTGTKYGIAVAGTWGAIVAALVTTVAAICKPPKIVPAATLDSEVQLAMSVLGDSMALTAMGDPLAGQLWNAGPPQFMFFSDRPEGSNYTIWGRGYGIAWGSVQVGELDRGDLTEWYDFIADVAVWWDDTGEPHYVSLEPIERDGLHFVAAVAKEYLPELGMLEVEAYCVEFYEWLAAHPGEPTNDWTGDRRYATMRLPITPPWADFNADGAINTMDFTAFMNAWAAQRPVE